MSRWAERVSRRERALALAREAGCRAVGVWIDTPLDLAFAQNAQRPGLARILEKTIRRAFEQLEPPSRDEGFAEVIRVTPGSGSA